MFNKLRKELAPRNKKSSNPNTARKEEYQESLPDDTTLSPIDITIEPKTFTTPCGYVPTVLVNASKIVESHIMDRELFQIQGSMEKVEYLNHVLGRKRLTMPRNTSVHDVTEVIKVFLSRLSTEIIPEEIMTNLIDIHQGATYADYFNVIQKYYTILPDVCPSVHFVLRLLNKVARHSLHNGMDARKLATIFVLDILKPLSQTGDGNEDAQENRLRRVQRLPYNIMAIEYLIHNVSIFEMALPLKPADLEDYNQRNNNKEQRSECTDDIKQWTVEDIDDEDENDSETRLLMDLPSCQDLKEQAMRQPSVNSSSGIRYKRSSPAKQITRGPSLSAPKKDKPQSGFSSLDSKRDLASNNSTTNTKYAAAIEEKRSSAKERVPVAGPHKTREVQRMRKPQGLTSFRKRFRSHSDSAKDLAEFKMSHRFKMNKRTKSKEAKYKSVGSKLFRTDEELLPWGGIQQTESEDVSLIVQSTQNPKTFQFLDNYHSMAFTPNKDIIVVEAVAAAHPDHHNSRKSRRNKNKCSSAKRKYSNPRSHSQPKTTKSVSASTEIKSVQTEEECLPSLKPTVAVSPEVEPKTENTTHRTHTQPPPTTAKPTDKTSSEQISIPQHTQPVMTIPDRTSNSIPPTPFPRPPQPPASVSNYHRLRRHLTDASHTEHSFRSALRKSDGGGLRKDRKESPANWSNIIEWLCDIVLIVIAIVCAIYIYHLVLI